MTWSLFPDEPPASGWRVRRIADVLATLPREPPDTAIPVLAVDGRSGGGKTTVAQRLAAHVPGAAVVHTDDVAWHHSFFGWTDLLRAGVLEPARRGAVPVAFRPPAWEARGRQGAVCVPAACRLLIVEGVGAGRRELSDRTDALIWVQSDATEARRRAIARDGGDAAAATFWDEWEAEEVPFLAHQRPWDRADLVVAGTPDLPHDPDTELVVAPPPRADR
ncbi:MAG: hypothetical protein M3P48_11870 [Actinomycetota bacterium]|nr:hypothetical protein [Actinomycetota bacterium]